MYFWFDLKYLLRGIYSFFYDNEKINFQNSNKLYSFNYRL